jgi:hypothetical protein
VDRSQIRPFLKSRASPDPKHSRRQLTRHHNPDDTMLLQRSALALARRAAVAPAIRRSIATTAVRRKQNTRSKEASFKMSRMLVTELPTPLN